MRGLAYGMWRGYRDPCQNAVALGLTICGRGQQKPAVIPKRIETKADSATKRRAGPARKRNPRKGSGHMIPSQQKQALAVMRRNRRGLRNRGLTRATLTVVETHIRLLLDDPRHGIAGTARVEGITRQTAHEHLTKARDAGLVVRVGRAWFLRAAALLAMTPEFVRERLEAARARAEAKRAKQRKALAEFESVRSDLTHTSSLDINGMRTLISRAENDAWLAEMRRKRGYSA